VVLDGGSCAIASYFDEQSLWIELRNESFRSWGKLGSLQPWSYALEGGTPCFTLILFRGMQPPVPLLKGFQWDGMVAIAF